MALHSHRILLILCAKMNFFFSFNCLLSGLKKKAAFRHIKKTRDRLTKMPSAGENLAPGIMQKSRTRSKSLQHLVCHRRHSRGRVPYGRACVHVESRRERTLQVFPFGATKCCGAQNVIYPPTLFSVRPPLFFLSAQPWRPLTHFLVQHNC